MNRDLLELAAAKQFLARARIGAFTIPPRESLSQWAEHNRFMASESSMILGAYSFQMVPYLRDICNTILHPKIDKTAIMGPARCGKTEALLLNPIAYIIDRQPGNILVLIPKDALLKTFITAKLEPMLRTTPCLRNKIGKQVAALRERANNQKLTSFLGGTLICANANIPDSYRVIESDLTVVDEIDEGNPDVGGQGNLVTLAETRGKTSPRSKIVLTGSPTDEGSSLIEQECLKSTDEYFHVPCPNPGCQVPQRLIHERLDWKSGFMYCESCGKSFSQYAWQVQAQHGTWKATNANPVPRTRSFRIDGLLSPWTDWQKFCSEWPAALGLAREGSPQTLKTLKNTTLGLLWQIDGDRKRLGFEELWERREIYSEIPDEVLTITAAVDAQDNRLHFSIWGWGMDSEGWLLDYGIIDGNPALQSTWDKLDEQVTFSRFGNLEISRMFIDFGGHMGEHVWNYVRGRSPKVWAIRGSSALDPKSWVTLFPAKGEKVTSHKELDTQGIKDQIDIRLRIQPGDPGCLHFPKTAEDQAARGADINYFKDLVREFKKAKTVNGLIVYGWHNPRHGQNESWDLLVYCYAALHDLGGSEYLKRLWNLKNPGDQPAEEPEAPRWMRHGKARTGKSAWAPQQPPSSDEDRPSWAK